MIEKNTVPLSEDTTNIMEMIEDAAFDFTLPEPLPTTTLHISEHKAEVEPMVEVNDAAETFSTWTSLDDANFGLCLPAIEAEGRIELPVSVVGNNNVESSEADDLLKWIMDDNQIADFNFPNEVEEATRSFLIEEVKVEMGKATKANKRSRVKMEELTQEEKYRRMREQNNRASQACRAKRKRKLAEEEEGVDAGGEVQEDEGAEQQGQPGLQGEEEELTQEEKYRRMREQNNRASQAC